MQIYQHLHILPAFGWWLMLILCFDCEAHTYLMFTVRGKNPDVPLFTAYYIRSLENCYEVISRHTG